MASDPAPPIPVRQVNFKRLGCLLIVLALTVGGVYSLHGHQVRRNATILLDQAHKAEADGKLDEAISYLGRYLGLAPEDNDALGQYGIMLDKIATRTGSIGMRKSAFFTLETVVRKDPDRADIRRYLVGVAMSPEIERFADAAEHLNILLSAEGDDPELWALLARCHEGKKDYAAAADVYFKVIKRRPNQVNGYVHCAGLLRRRLDRAGEADALMANGSESVPGLLKNNADSAAAWIAHAKYVRDYGTGEERHKIAAADLKKARELAGDDADVLLASADHEVEMKRLERARDYLERGVQLYPNNVAVYRALARMDAEAGDLDDAVAQLTRGLEHLPTNTDLLLALVDVKVERGELAEASTRIKRLRHMGVSEYPLQLQEARILARNSEWLKASAILERLGPIFGRSSATEDSEKETILELGNCYDHMGKLDRRYQLFYTAMQLDPRWRPGVLGMAATLLAMGRLDEALETYHYIIDDVPQVRLDMLRLMIVRNLHRAAEDREWIEIRRLLRQLAADLPNSVDVLLLTAEMLAAEDPRDHCERARQFLTRASEEDPGQLPIRLALAAVIERQGELAEAFKTLDDAEKALGDRVAIRLARARLLSRGKDREQHERIKKLAEGIDGFTSADQELLLRGLGKALLSCGELSAAKAIWREVARRQPLDLDVRLVLFELARHEKDHETMQRILHDLQGDLDGPDGTHARFCEACMLTDKAVAGDEEARKRAWQVLIPLDNQRRTWSRIPALEAELYDAEGKNDLAVECLQRAFDLGNRSPLLVSRLESSLSEKSAEHPDYPLRHRQMLLRAPEPVAISSDLQHLISEIALRNQEQLKGDASLPKPGPAAEEYVNYLWLAQSARAIGDKVNAREALEKARAIGGHHAVVWVMSIDYMNAMEPNNKQEALKMLQEASLRIPDNPIALGFCHELLGDVDKAKELFLSAARRSPEDPVTLTAVATFLVRHGEFSQAHDWLEKVVAMKEKAPRVAFNARRLLTEIRVLQGDYEESRKALADLETLDAEMPADATQDEQARNQRAKAVVLGAQLDIHKRQEAIKILETMQKEDTLNFDDGLFLARIYDSVGKWSRSRELMLQSLSAKRAPAAALVDMAQRFLRHSDADDAESFVVALEKIENGRPPSFAATRLRAMLLNKAGKHKDAVDLLRAFGQRDEVDFKKLATVTEEIDAAAAESWYRKYAEQLKKPDGDLVLAAYLGRQGQTAKALDLCDVHWTDGNPADVAETCIAIVEACHGDREQSPRVASWLQRELARDGAPVEALKFQLANLRLLEGNYKDAIQGFREITRASSARPEALNNLAWLLTFHDGAREALSLIDLAQKKVGPEPGLLDSRALCLVKLGQAEQAIPILEDVVAEEPNSLYYFHLAEAYLAAKRVGDAASAFKKAEALGLKAESFNPLERPDYESVRTAIP